MRSAFRSACLNQPHFHLPRPLWPHSLISRRILTTSTSNTARIDIPKVLVSPGSRHHNSLSSFLEHAERRKLDPTTTVYSGTIYEYKAAESLKRLGFSLIRTGRTSDAGLDLVGYWILPPLREPLPIIVQCKATGSGCTPAYVRELEGSFGNVPVDWHRKDVLGLLVCIQQATSGVLHAIGVSRHPLGYVKISRDGTVEQMIWNRVAIERGLEGVGVTVRHTPRVLLPAADEWEPRDTSAKKHNHEIARRFRDTGTIQDIQLTWLGSPITPDLETVDEASKALLESIPVVKAPVIGSKKGPNGRPRGKKDGKPRLAPGTLTVGGKKLSDLSPKEQDELRRTYLKIGRPKGSKDKLPRKRTPAVKSRPEEQDKLQRTRKKIGRPKGSKNKGPRKRALVAKAKNGSDKPTKSKPMAKLIDEEGEAK
ncbi:hypothetical protein DM02DRAFT_620270 [Periconia macrospinosa]|uniref:Uncharacterized protein n=1 Tax=Periconia macrospinosa TaxID=97972 RepID=A0A2V1D1I7_9PLEO|nr:hypothetical protein DM02DRAFT_620270 [Periconia macrospinosa]